MTDLAIGFLSFPILLALIFARVPVGLSMFLVGMGGIYLITGGMNIPLGRLKYESYSTFSSYSLSIIPMFLLMGNFASLGGLSKSLFRAAEGLVGHRPGGLAMSAVAACAGFGAICGSSLATAATMGRIALPELRNAGYSGGFATATLAAGGTLGILIPPSIILVIYAILTEQNVAKLFVAAIIPGLLAALGYIIAIMVYVRLNPEAAGHRAAIPIRQRLRYLFDVWPVVFVFGLVVGGIYMGWFTPTEGAAVGAAGTGLIAWLNGGMNWQSLKESIHLTAISSAMVFFIILGAAIFNGFLALTNVPQTLSEVVVASNLSPWTILALLLLFYLIMGCVMDSLSMILLTIPVFFPIVASLDFGLLSLISEHVSEQTALRLSEEYTAIWFGILVLIVVEIGLITPPVGMNLFIINSMDRDTKLTDTYKAVLFFIASDLLRVGLLIAFPILSLYLILD